MLVEYARFVQEIFPAITPGAARQLIAQAGVTGFVDADYFATQLGDKLCQGDVVEGIEWLYQRTDGRYGRAARPGLLLSHSCDVDNPGWLVFAACVPFNASLGNAQAIKLQTVTELYYLPAHAGRPALVADLSQVQSLRGDRVLAGIASGALRRVDSFTPLGYWHFIAKLTVHLMRPQAADEIRFPSVPRARERVMHASAAAIGLLRYAIRGRSE